VAEHYLRIVLPEAAHGHAPYLDARATDYIPAVRERIALGRTILAVDHLAAQDFRVRLRASVDAHLQAADALVLPTQPMVAPQLGLQTVRLGADAIDVPLRAAMLRHTQPFNMTGHPAITLPIPTGGLPVGLQLVGPIGSTDRLLDIAAALEGCLT
jgi:aspartyl-tRNA(Asn)/glutamyl-tRNA(Gln) amidotransferase subunit A